MEWNAQRDFGKADMAYRYLLLQFYFTITAKLVDIKILALTIGAICESVN
jgi:hypothetical protein